MSPLNRSGSSTAQGGDPPIVEQRHFGGGTIPYRIEKHGNQHCVVKEKDGSEVGCHPTRAEAEAQMRALYANEKQKDAWEVRMRTVEDAFAASLRATREATVWLTDSKGTRSLRVLVAETHAEKTIGMTGHGLDDFDGMLFVEANDTLTAFHGRGTTEPLRLGFFDADGSLLEQVELLPGTGSFVPSRPYRYALELRSRDPAAAPPEMSPNARWLFPAAS